MQIKIVFLYIYCKFCRSCAAIVQLQSQLVIARNIDQFHIDIIIDSTNLLAGSSLLCNA